MKLCETPGERPATDDGYLDVMTKAIFTAGLNWKVIDNKWAAFRERFHNFSIEEVAALTADDIDRLAIDTAIVRNRRKIAATIENAHRLAALVAEYGSVGAYFDSLHNGDDEALVAAVSKQFAFLGPGSTRSFLHATGHIEWEHMMEAAAG